MGEFFLHHVKFFDYQPQSIDCLALNPTTNHIAAARADKSIEIWDPNSSWHQTSIIRLSNKSSLEALCWAGEYRLFSAGLDGNICEYNLTTLQLERFVSSNSGGIWCLSLSDSHNQIAAGTESGTVVLFDITAGGLNYSRNFDRQSGTSARILSINWHDCDKLILTGGVDNIRIWNVQTGHALQRLTLSRSRPDKETIVWSLAVTRDFVIISGDSTGRTIFWNGKQGTQINSFRAHKADVLSVAVNKDGDRVFSTGIDPLIVEFNFVATRADSDWKTWTRGRVRADHSHDVRALVCIDNTYVISAGVDCSIICSPIIFEKKAKYYKHPIGWKSHGVLPQRQLVYVAYKLKMVLLRYQTHLELWRLGSTTQNSDKHCVDLELNSKPIKLMQIDSQADEAITCAAISVNGSWVAYSNRKKLRVFRLNIQMSDVPNVELLRVKVPSKLGPVSEIIFTEDEGTMAVVESHQVHILSTADDKLSVESTIDPTDYHQCEKSHLSLLSISKNKQFLAFTDASRKVYVFSFESKMELLTVLPLVKSSVTAMAFHPSLPYLCVIHANRKVVEFDVSLNTYTKWKCAHFPTDWTERQERIPYVKYNPYNPQQILMFDESSLCIIDKAEAMPPRETPLPFNQPWTNKKCRTQALHISDKFKWILHADVLDKDSLLVVERPEVSLTDNLPPVFSKKKFGT